MRSLWAVVALAATFAFSCELVGPAPAERGAEPPAGGPTSPARPPVTTTEAPGQGGAPGTGGAGSGGAAEPPGFACTASAAGAEMHDPAMQLVASYETELECQKALEHMGEGVVCAWFVPGMFIGPEAWDETGWRAMNVTSHMGLGRRPHTSFEDCLDATKNARGGVVCTNTGVGYKSAHIETNKWCGASSGFSYCLQASLAANEFHVCSFPSDGDGSGPGWVLTEIAGTTCNYLSASMPLADCNALIP
jgi:hypothetical protein